MECGKYASAAKELLSDCKSTGTESVEQAKGGGSKASNSNSFDI